MKLFIQFTLLLGVMIPSIVSCMQDDEDVKNLRNIGILNLRQHLSDADDESISNSLTDSIASPRRRSDEAEKLDREEQENKENACQKASSVSHALAANAHEIISKAHLSTRKHPNESSRFPNNSFVNNDHEWGDNIKSDNETPILHELFPFDESASKEINVDIDAIAPSNNNADYVPPLLPVLELSNAPILPKQNNHLAVDVLQPSNTPPALPAHSSEADEQPIDEQPIIVEMPDPDEQLAKQTNLNGSEAQEELDFTKSLPPRSNGVKAEIKHRTARPPQKPAATQTPRTPIKIKFAHKQPTAKRPLPPAPNSNPTQRTPHRGPLPRITPERTQAPLPQVKPQEQEFELPVMNLLLSAAAFGILSFVYEDVLPQENTQRNEFAREFVHGAQQAVAANMAQQMIPGKPANSAAFIALFSALHACEIGIRKAAHAALAKTKAGKTMAQKFRSLPKHKRSFIKTGAMATSWLFKTLIARALTA